MLKTFEMLFILFIGAFLGAALNQTWPVTALPKNWETLVAGGMALLGAVWTVFTLKEQIEENKKSHQDSINRKALVARGQMNDALNAICDYTRNCFNYIFNEEKKLPERPSADIQVFKNALEFINDTNSDKILDLVSFYQVFNANFSDYTHEGRDSHSYERMMLHVVKLNALALQLFPYAREGSKSPKPSYDEMMASLRSVAGINYYNIREGLIGAEQAIRRTCSNN